MASFQLFRLSCILISASILCVLAISIVYSIFAKFLLHEIVPYFAAHDMSADAKRGKVIAAILIIDAVMLALRTIKIGCKALTETIEEHTRTLGFIISCLISIALYGVLTAWLWKWHIYFRQQDGLEVWATRCYRMAVFLIVQIALEILMLLSSCISGHGASTAEARRDADIAL
ncbi:hypothetical protein SLS62_001347 [Diatrype stigma]|uniref:Uncharacterized protein n=1 Tax=Diatrype stigma TaxID=117547 RepID=A0AAN9YRQ8_9PEZI